MYIVKSRIWIENSHKTFLGEGRIELLKLIGQTQSLTKSAKMMEMSYKKAWNLLNSMNTNALFPVVISKSGGKDGGGTTLTPHGKQLIENYELMNKRCWKFLDKQMQLLFEEYKR